MNSSPAMTASKCSPVYNNNNSKTDLVLGARSVFSCADHHVDVVALARLVQMSPDGQHRSRPLASTPHPKCGEHPIHHLDLALQLHLKPGHQRLKSGLLPSPDALRL